MSDIIEIIDITRETCSRRFGVGECKATGEECFNTIATCKYLVAYDPIEHKDSFYSASRSIGEIDREFAYPFLDSIAHKSATINPSSSKSGSTSIGTRASLNIRLFDAAPDDLRQDPYYFNRDEETRLSSTFFSKYLARNKYLYGRRIDYTVKRKGAADVKRSFIITDIKGVDGSKSITIVGQDPLVLTDIKKAVFPPVIGLQLAVDINESETDIILTQVEASGAVSSDIDVISSGDIIRVDDEIMNVISVGGSTANVLRGAWGSEKTDHKQNTTIIKAHKITNQKPWQVVHTLLGATDIKDEFFDVEQWGDVTQDKPWLQVNINDVLLSKQDAIFNYLNDLSQQTGIYAYWHEESAKIRLGVSTADGEYISTAKVIGMEDIIDGSLIVSPNEKDVITRVSAYMGVRDWSKDLNKPEAYQSNYVFMSSEEQRYRRGSKSTMELYCYFLSDPLAYEASYRALEQFSKPTIDFTFEVDYKDSDISLSDHVLLNLYKDEYGRQSQLISLITNAKEVSAGHRIQVKGVHFEYAPLDRESSLEIPIPTNIRALNLRNYYISLRGQQAYDQLNSSDKVIFTVQAGAQVTGAYRFSLDTIDAISTGDWSDVGVELFLKISNGAMVEGVGGRAGAGGGSLITGSNEEVATVTASDGGDGGDGGNALRAEYPITITNNGVIRAGGGGGGGGGGGAFHYYAHSIPSFTFYVTRAAVSGGGGGGGSALGMGSPVFAPISDNVNWPLVDYLLDYGLKGENSTGAENYGSGGAGGIADGIAEHYQRNWAPPKITAGHGGRGGIIDKVGGSGELGAGGDGSDAVIELRQHHTLPIYAIGRGGKGGKAGKAIIGSSFITWDKLGVIQGDIT